MTVFKYSVGYVHDISKAPTTPPKLN